MNQFNLTIAVSKGRKDELLFEGSNLSFQSFLIALSDALDHNKGKKLVMTIKESGK